MAELKAGARIKSVVCSAEVMVIAAPKDSVEILCGGAPMIDLSADASGGASLDESKADGVALGKRYVSEAGDLELLCTKPGQGTLSVGGEDLKVKGAKPLPSSD